MGSRTIDTGYITDLVSSSLGSNGRHQKEDAGYEGGEGQCHGQI